MTDSYGHRVDWDRIADSVQMACQIRGCSLRDVSAAVGIPASGLTRLRQGKHLSADGLAALVAWLYPHDVPFWIMAVQP